MTPERQSALSALVRDGYALLAQAENGEWDRLAAAEARHRRDAEAFFSVVPQVSETTQLARALRELLDIQDELSALAVSRRDALQARIGNVRLGRRAVRAYASSAA